MAALGRAVRAVLDGNGKHGIAIVADGLDMNPTPAANVSMTRAASDA